MDPDQKTFDYLAQHGAGPYTAIHEDNDAQYFKTFEYDASELEPLVAKPYSPENVVPVQETAGIELDKSYIGSCTGAKYEDLEAVAKILKGRKVKTRTEILPAAISIYKKALDNGLIQIFMDAGAVVGPPTCGACWLKLSEILQTFFQYRLHQTALPCLKHHLFRYLQLFLR